MVVNRLRVIVAAAVITAILLLLWRVNTLTTAKDLAVKRVGQLQQSNEQLIADLASERRQLQTLRVSYEDEQGKIADLVRSLEQSKTKSMQRQKVIYETAINTDCGAQPLPDKLIRMRAARATASAG